MKKLKIVILTLLISAGVFAQCDPRLGIRIPDDPNHFIKSGDAFMPDRNDTLLTYTFILNKGKKYRISIFEINEFSGLASYTVYEGEKLVGSNYPASSDKCHSSFDFICGNTATYRMDIKKLTEKKYCGSWMIQEIGETNFLNKNIPVETEETFIIVEEMPEFKVGQDINSFRYWLQENLVYPEEALSKGISGKVFVQFAVNGYGDVVDAKIVRGVNPTLDNAALNLVKSSPRWEKPGKQRGKAVKVQFTFPVTFQLE